MTMFTYRTKIRIFAAAISICSLYLIFNGNFFKDILLFGSDNIKLIQVIATISGIAAIQLWKQDISLK